MATISAKKWQQRFDGIWKMADAGHTAGLNNARAFRSDVEKAFADGEMDADLWSALMHNCSSILVNFGKRKKKRNIVQEGIDCAQVVLDHGTSAGREADLTFNVANGLLNLVDLEFEIESAPAAKKAKTPFMLRHKESLREARVMMNRVGRDEATSGQTRGTALCNLANALDDSGRWVEAYQVYVDALEADPTNGNAAGNLAALLSRRIRAGRGLLGHYAAIHDHYLAIAKSLRHRTIQIAGVETADRWDATEFFDDHGHMEHGGDEFDAYQQWIKRHRLALALSVEGLGSDDPRWDSALPDSVAVLPGEPDPPLIIAAMNVLKGEFLAVRRLAFEGEQKLFESTFAQHPSDSGVYASTLDGSLYGEPTAMLVLAQRATLDLLDKIAVAANDHFKTGDRPGGVEFRKFWFNRGKNVIKPGLPSGAEIPASIALAELSFDEDSEGLYPNARVLRNAGTHRLVRVTHGEATGITDDAHSSVSMDELIAASHESLQVARAAYLYLIDLVADGEDETGSVNLRGLPLPNQD